MIHGLSGSVEIFWTRPPTVNERPDGVRSGCAGAGFGEGNPGDEGENEVWELGDEVKRGDARGGGTWYVGVELVLGHPHPIHAMLRLQWRQSVGHS